MPSMMGSVTRVLWLTSRTLRPARRRAAASVAPMLTRGNVPAAGFGYPGQAGGSGREGKPRSSGKLRAEAAQGGTLGAGLLGQGAGEDGQPGPELGPLGPPGGAEDADGEQAGVAGPADGDGGDRDAGRHLHDGQQRVEPAEVGQRDGHAD